MSFRSLGVALLVVAALIAAGSVFTVAEWEKAIKFRLGEIVRSDYEPGLHFKIPVINNVRTFDARIQTLDLPPERFLTAEKKNVIVDSFVKWRITDATRFYTAVGGDEAQARLRIAQIVQDEMRSEFGKRTIEEVVSGERVEIMNVLSANVREEAASLGIHVEDVRIKRVDLPEQVTTSIYQRMEAERARAAKEFRARGREAAERIRAEADRQAQVILAQAYREAEQLRGEGDKRAAAIYADVYGRNEEFYAFYRSLQAYVNSFDGKDDFLVLDPDGAFFRYFRSPTASAPTP